MLRQDSTTDCDAVAALDQYPAANVGCDLMNSTQFVAAPVIRDTTNSGTIELGDRLTGRDALSARYGIPDLMRYYPYDFGYKVSNLPGYGSNAFYPAQNTGLNWVHGFNPRVTNEFRAGFNHDRLGLFQQNQGINQSGRLALENFRKQGSQIFLTRQETGHLRRTGLKFEKKLLTVSAA
jgi:hypothetical protein